MFLFCRTIYAYLGAWSSFGFAAYGLPMLNFYLVTDSVTLSKFHACTNSSLWVRKITDPPPPRQTGDVPWIWWQAGENCLLSSQIDCWVSFMLVQMSHSGSVKLQIHLPGRLGLFHAYGGRPVKIVLSYPKLTSESYCVLVQMSYPHPVELHFSPPKLPLFHDPASGPVALSFLSYNLWKKYFVLVQMRHHLCWYLPYY